jgi:indole-3-glycerol phosphate synthase/phosphoribosylanthranilate isomerase
MSVLNNIVAQKRKDVARRIAQKPLSSLRAVKTTRHFGAALKNPGLRFILEFKKASPSEGLLRPDFDMAQIADIYRPFADAVSVLADEPYFQGNLANVEQARASLPQPVLCKDFIIDPYQVVEARAHGADAILLMLSVLNDNQYQYCAQAAKTLDMDILTEVHDEDELARALALDAQIIGINNRDLKTLKVDLDTTRRLAPKTPDDRIVVCESGIKTRADIDAINEYVDAFLIGSALMKETRLDLAVRALIFGRVKICGLTSIADAQAAYDVGASFGGMIFASESPRHISEAQAKTIRDAVPLPFVGVFVNENIERVVRLARDLDLAAVQLHGNETNATITELRKQLPEHCEIWKAVHVQNTIPVFTDIGADRLLFDTFDKQIRGGSGKTFDWNLLHDYPQKEYCVLAGGISVDNIREAHSIGCGILDVNSGVEITPGQKDYHAMCQLFSRLRGIS